MFVAGSWVPAYWLDEATTIALVRRSWSGLVAVIVQHDPALGGYYLLMKPIVDATSNPLAARLPTILAAAATVGLVTWFGSRTLGRAVGLLAGVLVIALPMASRYAQEVRPYALMLAATCTAVVAWWSAVHGTRRRTAWVVLAVSVAAICATNMLGLVVLAAPLVAALTVERGRRLRVVLLTVAVPAGVLLLLLPYVRLVQSRATGVAHPVPVTGDTVVGAVLAPAGGGPLGVVVVVVALAAAVALVRRPATRTLGVLLAGWAVLPPVLLTAMAVAGRPTLIPRYYVAGLAAWPLLLAVGVVWAARAFARRRGLGRGAVVVVAGVAAAVVVVAGLPEQLAIRQPAGHALPMAYAEDVRPVVAALRSPGDADLPVVFDDRVWTLSLQAYDPSLVATRMPQIQDPDPRGVIMPAPWPWAQTVARLKALTVMDLVVRDDPDTTVPVPDASLPPGLRDRGCTVESTRRFSGWAIERLVCPPVAP